MVLSICVDGLGEQVAEDAAELTDRLDAVRALPLRVAPLLRCDVAPRRETRPVGLDDLAAPVDVRLLHRGVDGRVDRDAQLTGALCGPHGAVLAHFRPPAAHSRRLASHRVVTGQGYEETPVVTISDRKI
jgi:hypothetical protein